MIDTFGTITLVKNDGLSATWLSDANYADGQMSWQEAVNWIDSLNSSSYLEHNDWHLPTTVDGPYIAGYDGTTTGGFNITSSEMGNVYHNVLENPSSYLPDGNPNSEWSTTSFNPGPFVNLQWQEYVRYWSGTENADSPGTAWSFKFLDGNQRNYSTSNNYFAWALFGNGVNAVPEPSTMIMVGLGLIGLVALRKKRQL